MTRLFRNDEDVSTRRVNEILGASDHSARICRLMDEKAETALSLGREDLARAALVEKQKATAEAAAFASKALLLDIIIEDAEEEIAKIQYLLRDVNALQPSLREPLDYH